MDMGFDHDAWPLGQAPAAEPDAFPERLDWHGLRARFLAVHACRQELGPNGSHAGEIVDASFDRSAARALAHFPHVSQRVNRNDSVDGKSHAGMGMDIVGASRLQVTEPSDRG